MDKPRLTRLIGIAGRKYAGKDTTADVFVKNFGYSPVAFAKPIKHMLWALLSGAAVPQKDIERMLHGDLKEVPTEALGGQTPRHALQTLGTDWGRRMIVDDLWIRTALADAAATSAPTIITDVRFPNEVAAIQNAGGIVIRVERANREPSPGDDHASETQIDELDVDHVLTNAGDNLINYRYFVRDWVGHTFGFQ